MRRSRLIAIGVLFTVAAFGLSGCSVASAAKNVVHVAQGRLADDIVKADLDETMTALTKYESANGTINGVTAAQLVKLGYMSSRDDKNFKLITSTHVDFCLQATSPTGTTFKDHYGDGGAGGPAEGACREGIDYD